MDINLENFYETCKLQFFVLFLNMQAPSPPLKRRKLSNGSDKSVERSTTNGTGELYFYFTEVSYYFFM